MKVLVISNYRDMSGWGTASMNNILALDSSGVDVVCRPITFGVQNPELEPRILDLENKSLSNIDACIQHMLPPYMTYQGPFKNIGYFEAENVDFKYSQWNKYLNNMDDVWVPNKELVKDCIISGVKKPKVINHCLNMEDYKNVDSRLTNSSIKTSYNFIFVGEFIKRKNIGTLLRAFHTEFHPSENVNLVLKINMPGKTGPETMRFFDEYHFNLKRHLKIRSKYKEPMVITGHLGHKELLSIMNQCHCFVSASYGEAWCIPALEAQAMGLNLIYTGNTGLSEFANPFSQQVNSRMVPCFDSADALPELYSSNDSWLEIDIYDLMNSMRYMYNLGKNFQKQKIIESVQRFDRKIVGQQMKEALNVE